MKSILTINSINLLSLKDQKLMFLLEIIYFLIITPIFNHPHSLYSNLCLNSTINNLDIDFL